MVYLLLLLCGIASVHSLQGATCGSITSPAPCGQQSDGEARCLSKGCCFNSSDSTTPCYYPGGNAAPSISVMHMIQASHFDAGFANSLAGILNLWWYTHFPRALSLGLALEANNTYWVNGVEIRDLQLRFTAQCWLIAMFLDCPQYALDLQCPTAAQRANLTQAIQAGYITWHAFPFNSEAELHNADLFGAGLDTCRRLDDSFGFPYKQTMSQRDVPGTTRSVVPLLNAQNVTTFSIGVNGASTPPFVPRAFVWSDEGTNTSLLTFVHPYGYGDIQYEDAVLVPGLDRGLVFAWRGDNAGPPESIAEIAGDYYSVLQTFKPTGGVTASTFDNFTQYLVGQSDLLAQLPVITSEIGDTWIHGAASDAVRVAYVKRAGTLYSACLADGSCSQSDPVIQNFTNFLLKCNEHTWGKDIKTYLGDTTHWTNAQLQAQIAANNSRFLDVIASWQEQRDWCITYSLGALSAGGHPLASAVAAALADLQPAAPPPLAGFSPFAPGTVYTAGRWSLAFDATTGAIAHLADAVTGQVWAQMSVDGSSLGLGHYVTLSAADYATYTGPEPNGYYPLPGTVPGWFALDFGKPNVSSASPVHQEVDSSLVSLWMSEANASQTTFLAQVAFNNGANASFSLQSYYGAPADAWLRVDVPRDASSPSISISFEIFNKTATRLPEGLFLRFNASQASAGGDPTSTAWRVLKLGHPVDPYDVVPGGNHHQHAFGAGGGMTISKGGDSISILSDEAAMTFFGAPSPLPTPVWANATDPSQGAGFLLMDNTWGTNYAAWMPWLPAPIEANSRWRFTLTATA